MINENKIREACASNRERGFKMLMDSFQVPIYNYIRRLDRKSTRLNSSH